MAWCFAAVCSALVSPAVMVSSLTARFTIARSSRAVVQRGRPWAGRRFRSPSSLCRITALRMTVCTTPNRRLVVKRHGLDDLVLREVGHAVKKQQAKHVNTADKYPCLHNHKKGGGSAAWCCSPECQSTQARHRQLPFKLTPTIQDLKNLATNKAAQQSPSALDPL